ncbi:hypothetical protein TcWFU_007788 [Taenia crassiceps]|uniref:RGS domain-containing protein n=1 Tax=Taenia crassiceps TaxID=6207 RepID=A0ABR4QMV9_9CEST
MNRRNGNENSFSFKPEGSASSDGMLDELREKISHLPVNSVTTIYFRYISREAKLPVDLPQELLLDTLLRIVENPSDIAAFGPCLQFVESKLYSRYLSPASDDFMGLTLEQYRGVLDAACAEKEPRENCFDDLYKLIYKTVEKNILPSFFVSAPFSRYRDKFVNKSGLKQRYIRKNAPGRHQPPRRLAPIQLNVLALSDASLANRLPRIYMEESASLDGNTHMTSKKWRKFYLLFKKDRNQQ